METSSLKESTSKDAIFSHDFFNLTEKSKGFLELNELPKEHYDLKSLYDTILLQDDEITQRHLFLSSYKSQPENKLKYPSPRSPTFSIHQNSYQDNNYTEKDNVFFESTSGSLSSCKSPTKLHQKWQQNVQKSTFSPIKPITSSSHHNEMSPSRNRRKLFRQLKHKPHPQTVSSLQSFCEDIPTIIEDSNNGGYTKNEEYTTRHWQQSLPPSASSSQNEANSHITWSTSIQESDLFQF